MFDIDPPWGEDPWAGVDTLPPMPEEPASLSEVPERSTADLEAELEAWLATQPPEERFAAQFGVLPDPEQLERFAPASLERAIALQDVAVQAAQVRTHADAHRIRTLLTAHDASIEDLTRRFGRAVADREGMGGTTFATSIALLTKADARHVKHEVGVGLILRDRLPLTWAAFQAGRTTWARAQKAVKEAEGLAPELWAAYDRAAAGIVLTSTRVKRDLRQARARLQPATAEERARTTFQRRGVTFEAGHDSGGALVIDGLATTWLPREEAVHRLAVAAHGVDPEHRTMTQLRHDIVERIFDLGLAAFQRSAAAGEEVVPATTKVKVELILTVPALGWLGVTPEQAILGGYGPISMVQAKELAGTATSFLRVLTDPVTGVRLTMDRTARKPPTDLARWVRIRDGRTRFPGRSTSAWLADLDHAWEWARDHGATNAENLITLDRPSHNTKSAGLYTDALLADGRARIIDPWGHVFDDPPDAPMDPAPIELREDAEHLSEIPDDAPPF